MKRIRVDEGLNTRETQLYNKIIRHGELIAEGVNTQDNTGVRIYAVSESRGYQTNFERKPFYYLVATRGKEVVLVQSITKGFQGRTNQSMYDWWESNFLFEVYNQEEFDNWLYRRNR